MIFVRPNYLLTGGILLFGLLLLAATLLTRRQRPHPLLHKAIWLVLAGALLAWANGGAAFSAIVIAAAAATYGAGRAIESSRERGRAHAARAWLACGLIVNLSALIAMKSAPLFAYAPGMQALGAHSSFLGTRVLLPLGLSYLTLHAASFLLDIYRGRTHAHLTASQAGVYLVLLPQFVAGPVAYRSSAIQLTRRAVGMSDFAYGVRRLAIGIGKRMLIAGPCAAAANEIFGRRAVDVNASAAWLAVACFTVQIYFTFSGYADMAIGLGRLFGLRLEENFRWPYEAESVRDFWRRWHMGLTAWFREYAFHGANDALVILLCAAWYGTTWGCLLWGAYHAALVTLERRGILRPVKLPWAFRHAYVVLAVAIGWVFLRASTPADAVLLLKAMAGQSAVSRFHPLPVSVELWAALAAGAIGSAPLARSLRRWSVAIDAATTSAVMMLFATGVFIWRGFALLLPRSEPLDRRLRKPHQLR